MGWTYTFRIAPVDESLRRGREKLQSSSPSDYVAPRISGALDDFEQLAPAPAVDERITTAVRRSGTNCATTSASIVPTI